MYIQKKNKSNGKKAIAWTVIILIIVFVGWLGLRAYVFSSLEPAGNNKVVITPASGDGSAEVEGTSQTQTSAATAVGTGTIPTQMLLPTSYYVSQTFNNCAPSALSMDLSFFNVSVSQQQIADDIRPDNNLTGKGDDKSTSVDQVVGEAEKYGLIAYARPNGNIDILKQFIANGIPVMVKSLLNTSETYAHYRVIKGYDDTTGTLTDEDGFQGPNIIFSYSDFMTIWKAFNYQYIVIAEPSQQALVEKILGDNLDEKTAWQGAVQTAQTALAANPNDSEAGFNLAVALYYTGDYQGSVDEYQKVAPSLSKYALWYQLEPIESYYELGDYSEVFSLANSILNNGNPAYPELYVLEGESYEKEGDTTEAKQAFQEALIYNKNLQSAQEDLNSLS